MNLKWEFCFSLNFLFYKYYFLVIFYKFAKQECFGQSGSYMKTHTWMNYNVVQFVVARLFDNLLVVVSYNFTPVSFIRTFTSLQTAVFIFDQFVFKRNIFIQPHSTTSKWNINKHTIIL